MSKICSSWPIWFTSRGSGVAVSENSVATMQSTGSGIGLPRCAIFSIIARASFTKSASTNDLPNSLPCASKQVLAMPPPTISSSTLSAKLFKMVSLVDTLLPATIATIGRAGCCRALPSASNSAAIKIPAQASGAAAATASVDAWARCAVPKASFTKISHKAA